MKIGDSISSYYRSQNGSQTTGSAASSLLLPTDSGSQRTQAPTVSIVGSASSSSLSSALWLSMADKLESDPTSAGDAGSLAKAPTETSAADEFMEWSTMSLAEKIRAQILGDKDLTEDDLAHMDADQRAAIEAEIKEAIKRQLVGNEDKGDLATTDSASV